MDIYTGISIIASVIAVIVSIVSHKTNKAINNQIQLQNNYFELCQKLQNLIDFGSENNLTSFKFDIENYSFYEKNSIEASKEFNNLQKGFSEKRTHLKSAYMDLTENFDFLFIQDIIPNLSKENQFDKWLNDTINTYFLKLDKYYDDLDRILVLARGAQEGMDFPNEKQIIGDFFDNIIDIMKTSQALQLLKRNMVGRFKSLSVREINAFNNNEILISSIKKDLYSFVMDFGIDNAIKSTDFSKIKKFCKDFGDRYDEFIKKEKSDYLTFLSIMRNPALKSK